VFVTSLYSLLPIVLYEYANRYLLLYCSLHFLLNYLKMIIQGNIDHKFLLGN